MDFLDLVLNILSSGLPCCLLALGIFLTFRILDFADLTAEGSFLLGACACCTMIFNGVNPWLATLVSFIVGFGCGLVTGALNRFLKIPKLLSGIITLTAAGSIAFLIMGMQNGATDSFMSTVSFTNLVGKDTPQQTIYSLFYPWTFTKGIWIVVRPWGEIIKVATMFAVVAIAMVGIYFFFGTKYGMAIRATGMNESMAKAQGINTNIATIMCVAISNSLIGLAGALFVQETRYASVTIANGFLVVGLASIIIGEAIFGKRSFKNWIISAALGAIIYFIIINVAIRLEIPNDAMSLLYAVMITVALCLPFIKEGIRSLIKKIKTSKKKEEASDNVGA